MEVTMDDLKDYLLAIRVPVRAIDDPDARVIARSILDDFRTAGLLGLEDDGTTEKLQRLEPGKPPIGIEI
jgi:hypothetical protein